MSRHDHRGRFTRGATPTHRQHGAPLLEIARKSPSHVRGEATKRANRRAVVMAMKERLDRELGRC